MSIEPLVDGSKHHLQDHLSRDGVATERNGIDDVPRRSPLHEIIIKLVQVFSRLSILANLYELNSELPRIGVDRIKIFRCVDECGGWIITWRTICDHDDVHWSHFVGTTSSQLAHVLFDDTGETLLRQRYATRLHS